MIETKTVRQCNQDYISDLTAFGWQPTGTERAGHARHHYNNQILARDMSMSHYNDLRKWEVEYEHAKSKIKPKVEIDGLTAFLLLLLFIFPGVIYLTIKNEKKNEVNKHNEECRRQMKVAVDNARKIY